MNITKWNSERIMQLPDWVFGEKYIVTCKVASSGANSIWDISEISYPNRMVLWQLNLAWINCNDATGYIRLAFGEKIPTSTVMMDGLKSVVTGLGQQGPEPRKIYGFTNMGQEVIDLRKYMEPQGHKLVVEATSVVGKATRVRIHTIVSSIPKEVPDWLISGRVGLP